MLAAHRLLGLGCACVAFLCGCGSSSFSSESGIGGVAAGTAAGAGGSGNTGGFTSDPPSVDGTHDGVVATPAMSPVSVEVGTIRTVSVTFTSSDGRTITGFGISSASGAALPAGWSAPASFGCASLSTGSGCVLNLTFTPTMYEVDQTLTLDYVYVDNSMEPVTTGSMTLTYQATSNDNVLATLAPIGQINATVNAGSQTVTATFTTDDGNPASAFSVSSDAAALPPGWTAPAQSSCATVSAGTPCQLAWVYKPTAPGNGTITIDYAFNDDSGTPKTASFNIPYAATANDNVWGMVSPAASPITATTGNSQAVMVTFTTDDGFQASNLSMELSPLPAGWSSTASQFTCATISTGNGCQLTLNYTPTAPEPTGTLQLTYSYLDNAGTPKNGAVDIVYGSP